MSPSASIATPRRSLSTRRGSLSASDPYAHNAEAETARGTASRITIVRVPQPEPEANSNVGGRHRDRERDLARRQSWGSSSSAGSTGRGAGGRLSFAFSSFTPVAPSGGPASPGGPGSSGPVRGGASTQQQQHSGPSSPGGFQRSGSGQSPDRFGGGMHGHGRSPNLTPQQICDLAASSISPRPQAGASTPVAPTPATFLLLPDEQYLPFLDRPAEVTALITSPPTSRLMALLSQTFPPDQRAPYNAQNPPSTLGDDPSIWSFAELNHWLQTADRETASDAEWVAKARSCVLARSELIWSRLKAALGVPPELEEEEDEDDIEDDHSSFDDDVLTHSPAREAVLEPILPGDIATCVASPLNTPDAALESIGERAEEELTASQSGNNTDSHDQEIQGLRLSTPMVEVLPARGPASAGARPVSPTASLRRTVSTSAATQADAGAARRRDALALAGPGRVRRSHQQERGTGDSLFPSSFATLTMGPSLVANNPALRSGPRRSFHPGVPISGRRGRFSMSAAGWDTDGNDYALSVGSGSEHSFAGH